MNRIVLLSALFACVGGCSPSPAAPTGASAGSGNGEIHGNNGQGRLPNIEIDGGTGDGECASVTQAASIARRPIDIIFVIDNSTSMVEEISSVKERINADFAQVIEAAEVDYRVIMISQSIPLLYQRGKRLPDGLSTLGDGLGVCVKAPLGKTDCLSDKGPNSLENPPRFFHYSREVASTDAWCVLFEGWSRPDELNRGTGWSKYLRPEAFKHFVVISDDASSCASLIDRRIAAFEPKGNLKQMAQDFVQKLLALSPEQFGSSEERRFRVHSIVGLQANNPASQAWPPTAPIQQEVCGPEAVNAGIAHQELSILTEGLRYPLCRSNDFNAIFRAVAHGVVSESKLSCEWEVPAPPSGASLDYGKVNLEHRSSKQAEPQTILKVVDEAACTIDGGWHYDRKDNPQKIVACPSTCQLLQASEDAEVNIAFGCETKTSDPK